MNRCSICHRDLPIAVDETDPTADELTVDARGVVRPGAYVCGACLDAAEDALTEVIRHGSFGPIVWDTATGETRLATQEDMDTLEVGDDLTPEEEAEIEE